MGDDRRSFGRNNVREHHSSTRSPMSDSHHRSDYDDSPRGDRDNRDRRSVKPSFSDHKQMMSRPDNHHRSDYNASPRGERDSQDRRSVKPSFSDHSPRGDRDNQDRRSVKPSFSDHNQMMPRPDNHHRSDYNASPRGERDSQDRRSVKPSFSNHSLRGDRDNQDRRSVKPSFSDHNQMMPRPDNHHRSDYNASPRGERDSQDRQSVKPSFSDHSRRGDRNNQDRRSVKPSFSDHNQMMPRPDNHHRSDYNASPRGERDSQDRRSVKRSFSDHSLRGDRDNQDRRSIKPSFSDHNQMVPKPDNHHRSDYNASPCGDRDNQDRRSIKPSSPDNKQMMPISTHRPTSRQEAIGNDNGGSGGSLNIDSASSLHNKSIRNRPIVNPELLQTRPKNCLTKKANDGTPISLQANYFRIITATDWCLYKYHVDFLPEEDQTGARKGMLKIHASTIGGYIYDGTVLYTSHRLPQPLKVQTTRKSDGASIQITLRHVGEIMKGDECYLQFYNIIMRKCQEYLQLQLVGRNFYDARSKVEVRQYGLELWPGLVTSIRQYENGILMCSEITYKVMRQQTVLDILRECYNRYGGHDYQARFSAQVIGLTVLTAYNNNTYRIEDVEYNVTPESTFTSKNGDVKYKDYYLNKYQINIRDLKQPLLLSRSKARDRRAGQTELVFLVPELCNTTGLTDEMRANHNMMRELANHTRINPKNRIERLLNFNRRLHNEPKVTKEFSDWNLKLSTDLVTVPARKLDPEDIWFGNAKISAGHQADWTQQLRNNRLFVAAKLQDWFVIVPNRLMKDAQAFIDTMRSSVRQMQFEIASPQFYPLNDDHSHSYVIAIEEIMSRNNPQMIMPIMTNNRNDRYAAIKKKCCIDRPVPSQCILGKNLNGRGVASIATKVAIQMNCKLGGTPWIAQVNSKTLMVVGFDVCHDTNNKSNSYGALVASLDRTYGRYFSAVSIHRSDEELSNNLAANMERALSQYKQFNKTLPDRIVVYRDGVSDGQLSYVHDHEVVNLQRKLVELYGSESLVKLAYIVVTKRMNTRLFHNQNNPLPGTIVDDVITNPVKYDFYIVSQSVRQGTVSPTLYNVIYDTCQYSPSIIQRLSYKLTHMYFNWSGTVRVPAPCQFAHKLAFFVSQSLHAIPSSHLENILYYL